MSTINRLSSVDVLQPSDQIPVWDSSNGDTRKASMSTLLAFVESYFADPDYSTRIVAPAVDYFTVDIGATGDSIWMIVNPTLNFTNGAITLPPATSAVNDQQITVVFTSSVSTFVITSSGATVLGAPTQINGYDSFSVRYNSAQQTWYNIGTTGSGSGSGVSQIVRQDFTGDGTTTTFALLNIPSALGNELQIFIDGVYQERAGYTVSGVNIIFSEAPPSLSNIEVLGWAVSIGAETSANLVSYTPAGTGAVLTTVQSKLRESVSVKDFGAVCDGVADDSVAVQAAIDHCAANNWPTLVVNGKCRIVTSIIINRLVDSTTSEFTIFGDGAEAGFYTDGNVTIFTSTLPYTTAPQSEFITFENIRFESSSFFNQSYVLSENFLRIKFVNCYFYLIRCILSTLYVQTLYFLNCNIRNNPASFVNCVGLYDVTFTSCIIENGQTIVRSVDLVRGTSGLRFIDSVIEAIQGGSVVVATGLSGFNLTGCHLESNFSPDFNFWGGTITNKSILISGNYIYNPNGVTFYYGPSESVVSSGNAVSPSAMHDNIVQVVNLVSIQDNSAGGISDATIFSTVNGVYRAGNATSTWTDSQNQIAKDSDGRFGIGIGVQSANRLTVAGEDQSSTKSTATFFDSAGNTTLSLRNDRLITMPALSDYADDTAAAAGSIPVGFLYRTGSIVKVRVA